MVKHDIRAVFLVELCLFGMENSKNLLVRELDEIVPRKFNVDEMSWGKLK
jgi:hypothetical protein